MQLTVWLIPNTHTYAYSDTCGCAMQQEEKNPPTHMHDMCTHKHGHKKNRLASVLQRLEHKKSYINIPNILSALLTKCQPVDRIYMTRVFHVLLPVPEGIMSSPWAAE